VPVDFQVDIEVGDASRSVTVASIVSDIAGRASAPNVPLVVLRASARGVVLDTDPRAEGGLVAASALVMAPCGEVTMDMRGGAAPAAPPRMAIQLVPDVARFEIECPVVESYEQLGAPPVIFARVRHADARSRSTTAPRKSCSARTTVTGSWPRPRWFDTCMWGRPLDTCMLDIRFREKLQDALAVVVGDQERAGLDIVTHGDFHCDEDMAGRSWHHYPLQRWTGLEGDHLQSEQTRSPWLRYPPGTLLNEIYTGWRWPFVTDKIEHRSLGYASSGGWPRPRPASL
jgi:hypothetical protein